MSMIDLFPSRVVAIEIAGFSIHWYGLLYFAAFIIAWVLLPRLQRFRGLALTQEQWSSLLSWAVLGVILGGRLGFVLFYEPWYFMRHPLEIFAVWNGGMSSHGGFIGVTAALLWATRHMADKRLLIADVVVVPIALGLACGRVGNLINQELYGAVTSMPWGVVVPDVPGLRHPAQVYAILKNLLIAAVCLWYLKRHPFVAGRTLALFCMLYGVLRFIVEFFREQFASPVLGLTEGQWLTIPVIIAGVVLWRRLGRFVQAE